MLILLSVMVSLIEVCTKTTLVGTVYSLKLSASQRNQESRCSGEVQVVILVGGSLGVFICKVFSFKLLLFHM